VRLLWSESAAVDLAAIYDWLRQDSQTVAERTLDQLIRRGEQIVLFPRSGRVVPEFGVRQVREVIEGPYRLVYHVGAASIEVLAVFHGARRL
jgi:plasmid stabilization system protein ParE